MIKVLVIRFSSIGDIVLTSPVIRCLKKQVDSEVHFVTKSQYTSILTPNPYINKVWSFKENINEIIPDLLEEHFDYIIDLHKNLRSSLLKKKLNVKSFSFNKVNIEKWLMVNLKINKLPDTHIVDRYLDAVKPLKVSNDNLGLDFFISKSDEEIAKNFLSSNQLNSPYITIAIGAQHATKIPTTDFFIQLSKELKCKVLLLGGPNDKEKGKFIAKEAGKHVINTAGHLSLGASAFIIQNSEWTITPDTGLMHIAAALNKKIISIWGSTVPEFGMYPYRPKDSNIPTKIIENTSISCRPCSKIGFEKCPKNHFNCMSEINVKDILIMLNHGKFDFNT